MTHPDESKQPERSQTTPTRFVSVGDVRFAYRRFGKPSPTPLLLLQHFRCVRNLGVSIWHPGSPRNGWPIRCGTSHVNRGSASWWERSSGGKLPPAPTAQPTGYTAERPSVLPPSWVALSHGLKGGGVALPGLAPQQQRVALADGLGDLILALA